MNQQRHRATLHVVIPFYNEGGTIQACAQRVLAARLPEGWSPAVVVVDDHSDAEDRRVLEALAEGLQGEGHRVRTLRHEANRGKGAALQTGFDAVLALGPPSDDLVVIQDADLEYDPADYQCLMDPLLRGEAEVVIGSRWGRHRAVTGIKRTLHAWVNGGLTRLSNKMTGYRLRDMECCYKMLTVGLLRRLRPWLTEQRYGIEPQIVAVLSALGAHVAEVPVSYDPRSAAEGKKIRWTDGLRALVVITRERFRHVPSTPPKGAAP